MGIVFMRACDNAAAMRHAWLTGCENGSYVILRGYPASNDIRGPEWAGHDVGRAAHARWQG